MSVAEVAVDSPGAKYDTFTYRIPEGLPVTLGQLVWVPFGPQLLQGVVLGVGETSNVDNLRDIADLIDERPLLSPTQAALALWISKHYLASPYAAASLMLPPGIERRLTTTLVPTSVRPFPSLLTSLSDEEKRVYERICRTRGVDLDALKLVVPAGQVRSTVDRLVRKGLVSKTTQLARPKVGPKLERYVRLLIADPELPTRAKAQAAVVAFLKEQAKIAFPDDLPSRASPEGFAYRLADLIKATKATGSTIAALVKNEILALEEREVRRDPLAHAEIRPEPPVELTPAQLAIWQELESKLGRTGSFMVSHLRTIGDLLLSDTRPEVFLLHGVTGSGKTEIYLRAIDRILSQGKGAIVMVPEIALTPQTVSRFLARFAGRVAVLHSRLSPGEQFDEWRRISDGEADIVVGPRSAVYAPVRRLGLIIVDEEHEWTYKQEQQPPFYHARDVAIRLAGLSGAAVILGSATPDVVTYTRALNGEYRLLELPERVTLAGTPAPASAEQNAVRILSIAELPAVELVDMRRELRTGNRSIFSRSLHASIREALQAGQQVILFLNRRGAATFVICRACGHVLHCRRCDIALTYHSAEDGLLCHYCGYRAAVPGVCPACHSPRIRYFGLGTEKLEEEVAREFPAARLLRWDRDVTHGRHSHERILQQFVAHEADVLIGTQMIAKGLHLPLVTVVGVVSADVGLFLPDYRAGERAFQILTQVAGRAGRGPWSGRVIVQTYNPEHYALRAVQKQDYLAFYRQEIEYRRQHGNPPFSRLVRLQYAYSNARRCEKEAQRVGDQLRSLVLERGLANVTIVGPAPAFVRRVRARYRWQIVIRAPEPANLVADLHLPAGWSVDVDPVTIL